MAEKLAKFCPGCGYTIILTLFGQLVKKMGVSSRIVIGLDIGCSLLAWDFLPLNTFQTHHGRVTPVMMGFKRAREGAICVGVTGDGGAYAIGLQSLIYAVKRDEPIFVLVVNNTVYAMTGGQSAPTTCRGQKTDTHPEGYNEDPFKGPEILSQVAARGAYLARTVVNTPTEMTACLEKAVTTVESGHFALLEILSFCPTTWRTTGKETNAYLENLKMVFELRDFSPS